MNRKVDSDWRKVRMEYVYVYQFQPYKGAFTLTLAEHPCPSLRPSSWPSCVYTTSEARIRGHPRPSEAIAISVWKEQRF